MASMISELPGSATRAADSLRARVAAATPVITIDRTVRLRSEQGGEYTCFEVTVSVSEHSWVLQKRYSEFEELYRHLFAAHSKVVAAERWPAFPEKTWLSRFDQAIVETRRQGLQVFLQACVARTLYPVVLDKRLRAFLSLDDGIQRAVELEGAKVAEATAAVQRHAAAKARMQLEVQRKRMAHDKAVERDRARHRTATGSCSSVTIGPHVSCGAVVLTPLVEAHRRYIAAGEALAQPTGDHEAAKTAARERFGALCATWGVLSPPAEVLVTGLTPAATDRGIARDEQAPESATREASTPASTHVTAPATGGGFGGCYIAGALGLIIVCTAGWAVGARESGTGSLPTSLSAALRRLPILYSRSGN